MHKFINRMLDIMFVIMVITVFVVLMPGSPAQAENYSPGHPYYIEGIDSPILPADLAYDELRDQQRRDRFEAEMRDERIQQEARDDIYYEGLTTDGAYD